MNNKRTYIPIVIGAIVLTFFMTWYFSNKAHDFSCADTTVVAVSGDTFWDIAEEHCTGHTGHAVYEMVQLNGKTLSVGQTVQLPWSPDLR